MASKVRKIDYYTILKNNWTKNENKLVPFFEIVDLFSFIISKNKTERIHPLKQSKSCYLASINIDSENEGFTIITGFFKSGVSNFRPNLINVQTGEERDSPKNIDEGDVEKTHFCIKINSNEVFFILEKNGNGVSENQIVDYFKAFNRQWCLSINKTKNYSLVLAAIGREDFIEAVNGLSRAQVAEVYFEKSLVGSEALNFSNRLIPLKNNVFLTMRAQKSESIKETLLEMAAKMNIARNKITKIRIFGKDNENHEVLIDSGFLCKKSTIEVDLNPSTGEIITINILTELRQLIEILE
ncbi:hypothetical protein MASR2M69_06860 [Bacteroidota bacterium]